MAGPSIGDPASIQPRIEFALGRIFYLWPLIFYGLRRFFCDRSPAVFAVSE